MYPSRSRASSGRSHCIRLLLPAAIVAGVGSSLRAQVDLADLSMEQLMEVKIESVYGASRYEQKVTRAPSSVTILDRDEIRRFGARSYAELLRSVRGIYVSEDRNYAYLGMRGFLRPGDYNTRTLMLLDGHRLNENIFDSLYLDQNGLLDLDLVERIEVVRGPSSSVYGSNAFFGVINVIPRRGGDVDGVELAAEAGSLGSRQARVTYGTSWAKGGELLVSASFFESRGNGRLYYPEFDPRLSEDPRAANDGWSEDRDGEDARHLYVAASYGDLKLTLFGSSRSRDVPTASFGTAFNAGAEWSRDDRGYLEVQFDREVGEETRLHVRSYLDGYRYLGVYPYLLDEEDPSAGIYDNLDQAYGWWTGLEGHVVRQFRAGHTLLVGGEYRANLRQDMFNFDVGDERVYYVDWRQTSSVRAVYTEAELTLGDHWLFTGGLRYDGGSATGSGRVHPRLSAIVTPWEGGTVKLLYGSAFRAPNAYERGYLEGGDALDSERIDTYEAVLEQYWQEQYRAAVSAYAYEVRDLITIGGDDDEFQSVENIGRTSARGVEAEVERRGPSGTLIRTSAALQRSEDRSNEQELTNSPRRLLKAQVLLPLWKDATAGIDLQYNSSVHALNGAHVPSFWLTNVTLFQGALGPVTATASVYNLLDETYAYPGATDHLQAMIEQNGRTFRVKLEYRF